MSPLAIIGRLLAGPVLNALTDAYKAKLEAGQSSERIAAELAAKELAVEAKLAELRTQVIISEQGRWYTAAIRPAFALVILIYFAKVIVWDKVLGLGTTDPLTGTVGDWAGIIITAYFGGRTVEKVARIVARK